MRTPHLATATLAASAARAGGSQTLAEGNPLELTYRMIPNRTGYQRYVSLRSGCLPGSYKTSGNQNKVRKGRRPAHAAGCKKAFA